MAGELCVICNGTGLIRKDGLPVRPDYATMPAIMADHTPCWGCVLGEQEQGLWRHWNAEMSKPLLSRAEAGEVETV
jgi:hypothetical protein